MLFLEDNIASLLHTFQESNYALLLELVAGANGVTSCASELLIVYYFSCNPLTKARAKELLFQADIEPLKHFIEQEPTLILDDNKAYYTVSKQETLLQKLHQLAAIPVLSIGKLAVAIALCQQQAAGLALDYAEKEQQHQIIKNCLQGQAIFYLNKHNSLRYFPSELTNFKALSHLTFFIKEHYQKEGNLLPNYQFYLPDNLQQLQQLRALHLYGGVVQNFPNQAIQQLSNLKSISLTTKQKVDLEELQLALPNCQLNIRTV